MNILLYLYNTPKPNGGGVSRMTCSIADALKARGYQVSYLCFEMLDTDVPLNNIFYFPVLKSATAEENRAYLKQFLVEKNIQFVINQIPLNEQFADLLYDVKFAGVRIASVIHNSSLNLVRHFAYNKEYDLRKQGCIWLFHLLRSWPIKQLIVELYSRKHRSHYQKMERGSDYIIAVSDHNIDDICTLIGFRSPKVISISNFIDTTNESIPTKGKLVIWCGRLEVHNKRADLMIDIWSCVCKQHPDWKIALMGVEEKNGLREYATSIGANNIVFTGPVNTEDYYRPASIICHTSLSESFGLVLAEAMNWGCVPMAFDSFPACRDIIADGCGIRIPAFDVDAYAKSLSELMDSEERRNVIAKKAKAYVEKYGEENTISKWLRLIEEK